MTLIPGLEVQYQRFQVLANAGETLKLADSLRRLPVSRERVVNEQTYETIGMAAQFIATLQTSPDEVRSALQYLVEHPLQESLHRIGQYKEPEERDGLQQEMALQMQAALAVMADTDAQPLPLVERILGLNHVKNGWLDHDILQGLLNAIDIANGTAELAIWLEGRERSLPQCDIDKAIKVARLLAGQGRVQEIPAGVDPINFIEQSLERGHMRLIGISRDDFMASLGDAQTLTEIYLLAESVDHLYDCNFFPLHRDDTKAQFLVDLLNQRPTLVPGESMDDLEGGYACVPVRIVLDHVLPSDYRMLTLDQHEHHTGQLRHSGYVVDATSSNVKLSRLEMWRAAGYFGSGQEPAATAAVIGSVLFNLSGFNTDRLHQKLRDQYRLFHTASSLTLSAATSIREARNSMIETWYCLKYAEHLHPSHPDVAYEFAYYADIFEEDDRIHLPPDFRRDMLAKAIRLAKENRQAIAALEGFPYDPLWSEERIAEVEAELREMGEISG